MIKHEEDVSGGSVLAWLQCSECLKIIPGNLQSGKQGSLLLKVDFPKVACSWPSLAGRLLHLEDEMCKEVIQALVSLSLLKCEEEPFGLVLKQVPLECNSIQSFYESFPRQKAGIPVSLFGICIEVHQPRLEPYCRTLECSACGEIQRVFRGQKPAMCCQESACEPSLRAEHLQCRTQQTMQQIILRDVHSSEYAKPHFLMGRKTDMEVEIVEHCWIEGLTLGSMVSVFGHLAVDVSTPQGSTRKLLTQVKVIGNNVEVIGSRLLLTANPLCDAWAEWRRSTLSQPRLLLDNLLGAVHSCLQRRLPTRILCCLLLSAASVPGKGGLDCSSLLHVLCGWEGHQPCFVRGVHRAARLLSAHCLAHNTGAPLLPSAKGGGKPADKQLVVSAGTLHATGYGVLVVDADTILKKEAVGFAEALKSGQMTPHALFPVPTTTAVWIIHSILQRQEVQTASCFGSAAESGELRDAVQLVCVADADSAEEDTIDTVLNDEGEEEAVVAELEMCIRHHMGAAVLGDTPQMTHAAHRMLQSYFLLIRQNNRPTGRKGVPIRMMNSLAMLAAASARLHHRNRIFALPDAALAVLMTEDTVREMGTLGGVRLPCVMTRPSPESSDCAVQDPEGSALGPSLWSRASSWSSKLRLCDRLDAVHAGLAQCMPEE